MQQRAFEILGIEPTTDPDVIRNAFVRLARIYHPDRFVGSPDDVRVEAERRMKLATSAYETLLAADRSAKESAQTARVHGHDAWEQARRWRAVVAERRTENEQRRQRWLVWEQLERQARERADLEAKLFRDVEDVIDLTTRMPRGAAPRTLAERLDDAREGEGTTPERGGSRHTRQRS